MCAIAGCGTRCPDGFGARLPTLEAPPIWIHGVSVGEVKGAGSLLRELGRRRPHVPLAVSSTTPAGMDVARRQFAEEAVFQFPLDLSFVVRRVLERLRPRAIVLMELEVWPNLLREATRRGIPVLVVNGRISQRSFQGYRRFRPLVPPFETIALYAVQTEAYAERLRALRVPADQIRVTGQSQVRQSADLSRRSSIGGPPRRGPARAMAPVCSSPAVPIPAKRRWSSIICRVWNARLPRMAASSDWSSSPVTSSALPRSVARWSAASVARFGSPSGRQDPSAADPADADVVVVDTIGELDLFYGIAELVFVGGSMVDRGGHNILEPAALGRPLVFGPYMDNFTEEARLLLEGRLRSRSRIHRRWGRSWNVCCGTAPPRRDWGAAARQTVARVQGTTERVADLVIEHLDLAGS